MQTTTDSSGLMTPRLISARVAASVVPPAGSVKIPSVLGQQLDRVEDLLVAHHRAAAAGLLHDLDDLEAVGRVADRQRLRNRVRLDRFRELQPLLERADHRRRARRLRRVDPRQLALDQPDFPELAQPLVDARQQRAAATGDTM